MPSLEALLDSLGFKHWMTVTTSFVLPFVSLIGCIFCSLSLFIFNRRRFVNPLFFYYRLLCIVYIIHLLHGIPYGLVFTPRYFPQLINTYVISLYQIYYMFASSFMFQVESGLQIAILLNRMRLFSPLVDKHFSALPRTLSFVIFSFFINFHILFFFKSDSFGEYCDDYKEENVTFYYSQSSDFSLTPVGQTVMGCIDFFLNLIVTLFAGVVLNIVSYLKFKSYMMQRRQEISSETELELISVNNRLMTHREVEQYYERQRVKHQIERNMFYMALTLCSMSILSRLLFMIAYVVYFLFYSFSISVYTYFISYIIFTLEPTLAIVVFYSFNRMFRKEFKTQLLRNDNTTSNAHRRN
jgi:hypothetical protein